MEILDLHDQPDRSALLALNNLNARETSLLTMERFDQLVGAAGVALYCSPAAALLLAFEESDDYDGRHFLWFRGRFDRFIYIDRVIVAASFRRHGLGRLLYADVFRRAQQLGCNTIVCEVNVEPPNPSSDQFHKALGFEEVGRATMENGAKTVRYLSVALSAGCTAKT
ncbi:GNAT family N-acetyltransferase [Bradyrhizobium sp. Ai1a-2]|uniref:GNAT family N-acetyltransferase n=1 Tax=Bradyrhizobium sp. Ai1a-2 TaxID=196490 RepID=UPI0005B78B9D|nr:GNAT family N-acetyltransferase [Bradyrhizobium sp. Ai1a-2]